MAHVFQVWRFASDYENSEEHPSTNLTDMNM